MVKKTINNLSEKKNKKYCGLLIDLKNKLNEE